MISSYEEIHIATNLDVMFRIYEDEADLITNHWHESFELIYLYDGTMTVTIQDKTHTLHQGQFLLINSSEIHSTLCEQHVKALLLQIPVCFFQESLPDVSHVYFYNVPSRHLKPDTYATITTLLCNMGDVYEAQEPWYSLQFKSLLYELVYTLMNTCYKTQSEATRIKSAKNLERLEAVTAYVRAHYKETISLDSIAKQVALNPEYFCRFFKRHMGQTFQEYVNQVRLTHVYQELTQTDLPVHIIMEQNGFSSYKLFSKYFKKTYHCTPSELRRL